MLSVADDVVLDARIVLSVADDVVLDALIVLSVADDMVLDDIVVLVEAVVGFVECIFEDVVFPSGKAGETDPIVFTSNDDFVLFIVEDIVLVCVVTRLPS